MTQKNYQAEQLLMTSSSIKKPDHNAGMVLNSIDPPKILGMGAGSIASEYYFTFDETPVLSLADKLEIMMDIQAVGVINKRGKVIGIKTRKDVFGILGRPFGREVLKKKDVASLVSEVDKFNKNDNIFTVSEIIEKKIKSNETHYFLLINDADEFCGIFSGKDMLVFLAEITRQDIALSRKIQTRIVKEEDHFSGSSFSLAASSVMAKGIGGDFYAYKQISDSIYLIALCDVSGKGMAASLLSSLLSGFINTYPIGNDLSGFIQALNHQLTQSFEGEKFVTGVFIIFNEKTGQAQFADMGHRHYLVFSHGKSVELENHKLNLPLGVSDDLKIETFTILLKKNDCMLLMTDGMIEQKDQNGKLYTYEQIIPLFSDHPKITAKGLKRRLSSDFDAFKGSAARQDDVSFLILKYLADDPKTATDDVPDKAGTTQEKIKWAMSTGKPIQIKTSKYMPADRDFIDTVLDRFLNEAGIKFLMNKISYCVHELATNSKKANTKRVYFETKGLDINNNKHYELGMKTFKTDTLDNIDFFLNKMKSSGYFIVIMFQLTKTELRISVVNNSEMTCEEKARVYHKLEITKNSASISEIYDQIEDYSEGAGLGIVMMSQMLRTMGLGPDVLNIESEQGLTTSSIKIKLRE